MPVREIVIVDLDRRADDKTNASVLILGNSGQGKSFLLKLLVTNISGSLLRRRAATIAATSWRLASAVTLCCMLLVLPRSNLPRRSLCPKTFWT